MKTQNLRRLNDNQLFTAINRGRMPDGTNVLWEDDDDLKLLIRELSALDDRSIDSLLTKLETESAVAVLGKAEARTCPDPSVRSFNQLVCKWIVFADSIKLNLWDCLPVTTQVVLAAVLCAAMYASVSIHEAKKLPLQSYVGARQPRFSTPKFVDARGGEQATHIDDGKNSREQVGSVREPNGSQNPSALPEAPRN
jgi:hypothetical protein